MLRKAYSVVILLCCSAGVVFGQSVQITDGFPILELDLNGRSVTIERVQDADHRLIGEYSKTSRSCPPDCIVPHQAAKGVETISELEVLDFLEQHVQSGSGILIDARPAEGRKQTIIPGSVNVPYVTVQADNPYKEKIVQALGAVGDDASGYDYSNALDIALYCDGPWSDYAVRAIKSLLSAGYPADKIKYYRGGVQSWVMLGFSTETP